MQWNMTNVSNSKDSNYFGMFHSTIVLKTIYIIWKLSYEILELLSWNDTSLTLYTITRHLSWSLSIFLLLLLLFFWKPLIKICHQGHKLCKDINVDMLPWWTEHVTLLIGSYVNWWTLQMGNSHLDSSSCQVW